MKHLGNIISNDLREDHEIRVKRSDFIGRVNSRTANFKSVDRDICSRVFSAKCSHFYGCQAWSLNSKAINSFNITWKKAVRKMWLLPSTARSCLLPLLAGSPPLLEQVVHRFAMYRNMIQRGQNQKMLLLANVSVNSRKSGITGENVNVISGEWFCGVDRQYILLLRLIIAAW